MAEFGESALIALIFISAFQALMPLFFYKASSLSLLRAEQGAQYFQFFLIFLSFAALIFLYVFTDLTIFNVALNTHLETPLLYKITGVWGNHEGSMLLWLFLLVFYGSAVAAVSTCPALLKIRVLSFQSLLTCAFSLFVFSTSNPFIKASVPFLIGRDLNPLLQDPALAFHPPALYLGFVGFSMAFSFALAALLEKKPDDRWLFWARPWILISWSFLTLGISMGSWWAYYELGWGGWWFWDPVENASLMPWLSGTALIHGIAAAQKRHTFIRGCYFLSLLCFLLSLLGTFLVRSGALSSVHSFANDSSRGIFLLMIWGGATLGSLGLFFYRFKKIISPLSSHPTPLLSRENGILFNTHFLLTLTFTVLLGTLYPLLMEALTGHTLTVGAPYFVSTFVPLSFPLLGLMGMSVAMKWGKKEIARKNAASLWGAFVLTLGTLLGLLLFQQSTQWRSILAISAAVWILASLLMSLIQKQKQNTFSMLLAHAGVAVVLLGMGIDSLGMRENLVGLREGHSLLFQGYTVTLKQVQRYHMPTYESERATLLLEKKGKTWKLFPEKRFYGSHQLLTTETALHSFWFSNLYVALGPLLPGKRWTVRLFYHPLVELIWLGGLLIAAAGFLRVLTLARKKMKFFPVLVILFLISPAQAINIGERLLNPGLEQRARALSQEIKCPVCAGQSIEDSQAPLAKTLRRLIREAILENKTDEEIRNSLARLYGEEILFKPVFDAKNMSLWVLPFLVALGGGGLLLRRLRKKTKEI